MSGKGLQLHQIRKFERFNFKHACKRCGKKLYGYNIARELCCGCQYIKQFRPSEFSVKPA